MEKSEIDTTLSQFGFDDVFVSLWTDHLDEVMKGGIRTLAHVCMNLGLPAWDGIIWEADVVIDEDEKQLKNKYAIKQRESGCYCFVAVNEARISVLYVGKAAKLTNRIQTHIEHSEWLGVWSETRDLDLLFCAYWITDNRAAFESQLIHALNPRYNRRKE